MSQQIRSSTRNLRLDDLAPTFVKLELRRKEKKESIQERYKLDYLVINVAKYSLCVCIMVYAYLSPV